MSRLGCADPAPGSLATAARRRTAVALAALALWTAVAAPAAASAPVLIDAAAPVARYPSQLGTVRVQTLATGLEHPWHWRFCPTETC